VCTNVGQFFDFVISYITSSPDAFFNFRTKQLMKVLAFWKISKDWWVFWQNWWFMRVHNLTNFLSFWEPWVTSQNWLFVFMRTTSQGSINLTLACWFLLWKRDRQLPNTGVYLLREVKHTWIEAHMDRCTQYMYSLWVYWHNVFPCVEASL
jgi:hypothetical protein